MLGVAGCYFCVVFTRFSCSFYLKIYREMVHYQFYKLHTQRERLKHLLNVNPYNRWEGKMGGAADKTISAPNWLSADWSNQLPKTLTQRLCHLREMPPFTPPVNDAGVSKTQILCVKGGGWIQKRKRFESSTWSCASDFEADSLSIFVTCLIKVCVVRTG